MITKISDVCIQTGSNNVLHKMYAVKHFGLYKQKPERMSNEQLILLKCMPSAWLGAMSKL